MDVDEEPGRWRRWLKLTLIVAAVVVLIVVIVMIISGGGHGPARHFSGATTPALSYLEGGSWIR